MPQSASSTFTTVFPSLGLENNFCKSHKSPDTNRRSKWCGWRLHHILQKRWVCQETLFLSAMRYWRQTKNKNHVMWISNHKFRTLVLSSHSRPRFLKKMFEYWANISLIYICINKDSLIHMKSVYFTLIHWYRFQIWSRVWSQ